MIKYTAKKCKLSEEVFPFEWSRCWSDEAQWARRPDIGYTRTQTHTHMEIHRIIRIPASRHSWVFQCDVTYMVCYELRRSIWNWIPRLHRPSSPRYIHLYFVKWPHMKREKRQASWCDLFRMALQHFYIAACLQVDLARGCTRYPGIHNTDPRCRQRSSTAFSTPFTAHLEQLRWQSIVTQCFAS